MLYIPTIDTTHRTCPLILTPRDRRALSLKQLRLYIAIFSLLWLVTTPAYTSEPDAGTELIKEIALDAETDATVHIYPAKGSYRILWIPAYATPQSAARKIALQLNQLDIEVWYVDLLDARFLPKTSSSIYKIRENDIKTIINSVKQETSKKFYLFAENRAVVPVLLALREMQSSLDPLTNFGGVIMNGPYLFIETPDPGTPAQLMPIATATNLPVYIFQPKDSPRYWQLKQSISALENSGSDVFVQVLPGSRGRFLFREDASLREDAFTENFGQLIAQAVKYLETINDKARKAVPQKLVTIRNAGGKKDRSLQAYQGDPRPPPLTLNNLAGRQIDLKKFKNQVILVNFWATWCPPCVEEMPSLQRLSKKLPDSLFVILGINIAEEKSVIQKFLSEQVKIDFPILLDSNGSVMRQWNVMAFPTSFVVDKKGKIRYALFGSIEWDTPDIINTIQALLNE